MNNNKTRRVPAWDRIIIAIVIVLWCIFVGINGCSEPRIEAEYGDAVAGCTARYGEGNDTQCIERVNERFNR